MTTFVNVAVVQNFFDRFPPPNNFVPVLDQFRNGKISVGLAVRTWWYFPGLVSLLFTTYAGDAEDHTAVREFCARWKEQHPHCGTWAFMRLHEAWLAKAAVDTVISASKDHK